MPWTVEYGFARNKEEQANPSPGMMMKAEKTFLSKQAAMDFAGRRIKMGATNAVVHDEDGQVVAGFREIWAHAFLARPAGE